MPNEVQGPWSSKWRVIGHLGRGGQAVTLEVESIESGEKAVLKRLHEDRRRNAHARTRMARELLGLRSVHQAGGRVPRVIDENLLEVHQSRDREPYFVMEFVDGSTLQRHLDSHGPLPLEESLSIADSVLSTIAIGHRESLQHRDVKPQNIVVRERNGDWEAVMLDYGLCFNDTQSEAESLTFVYEDVGNRFLLLPEHRAGSDQRDYRSDLTMVCGILFFCLTARYPTQLRDAVNKPPHRREGVVLSTVSHPNQLREVERLFDQGFQWEANHRFQTADDLLGRLTRVRASTDSAAPVDLAATVGRFKRDLLASNRDAQLHSLAPLSSNVTEAVVQAFHLHAKDFGPAIAATWYGSTNEVPSGFERIRDGVTIHISPHGHKEVRMIEYAVFARGWVCYLFRRMLAGTPNSGQGPVTNWFEVLSLDGERMAAVDQPLVEIIFSDVERALAEALDDFRL